MRGPRAGQLTARPSGMARIRPAMIVETNSTAMAAFILHLDDPFATDPDRVGPKAANLAGLARAGLPTPGGFCLTADAYHAQIAALGLEPVVARFAAADLVTQRRLAVEIRLGLYQQPIAREILDPMLAAW